MIICYRQVFFLNVLKLKPLYKKLKLKPLYKQGDKTSMTNYRSVSLLMVFSKVLEKVMQLIKQTPAYINGLLLII